MSDTVIFQSSDLTKRRVEFLDAARNGVARVRDKDGTSLVMLRESQLLLLEELAHWSHAHLRLERILSRPAPASVSDLGDLAWLRVFDAEDRRLFLEELYEALVASHADRRPDALDELVGAWRLTAAQLEDPLRRSVLTSPLDVDDLVEVGPPVEPAES